MRLLLVFLIAMIYGLPELAAQVPSVAGVRSLLAPDGNEAHIPLSADLTPRQSELQSTGAERFVGGVIVGAIAAMATVLADVDYNYSLLAYSLGSAGGVLIATAKRETPKPLPVLLGTALGALPLIAVAQSDRDGPLLVQALLVGTITTPLLGAAGQRW